MENKNCFVYDSGVPVETEKVNNPVTHAWLRALSTV